ncbi:uncharacterized protein [Malus domestica]|uniref:uncharacterized protein isoform X2 n=1 Tax=Malus domestica TaxID=3750 RepID=UPI0007EE07DD|nr:uncharacterized protein LOC103400908 isoform X2 [Malus domestica]
MASLLCAFDTGVGDWDFYAALSARPAPHSAKGYSFAEALSHSQCHCLQAQYAKPVPFPIFGVLKKEKHVLLPSVADVVIEQGYLQSLFGVYSLRIEHVGVRRPPSDDVQIHGIANPSAFRKAVLMRLASMTNEVFTRQVSTLEDIPNLKLQGSPSKSLRYGDLTLLQKLEEVGSSVKRVQTILEEQHPQTLEPIGGSARRVLNFV